MEINGNRFIGKINLGGGCPYQWDLTKWKTYLCEDHKIIFRHIGERLEKYLDLANEK